LGGTQRSRFMPEPSMAGACRTFPTMIRSRRSEPARRFSSSSARLSH